jgi:hypothetical protein
VTQQQRTTLPAPIDRKSTRPRPPSLRIVATPVVSVLGIVVSFGTGFVTFCCTASAVSAVPVLAVAMFVFEAKSL